VLRVTSVGPERRDGRVGWDVAIATAVRQRQLGPGTPAGGARGVPPPSRTATLDVRHTLTPLARIGAVSVLAVVARRGPRLVDSHSSVADLTRVALLGRNAVQCVQA
jgi:hypothetical protein